MTFNFTSFVLVLRSLEKQFNEAGLDNAARATFAGAIERHVAKLLACVQEEAARLHDMHVDEILSHERAKPSNRTRK